MTGGTYSILHPDPRSKHTVEGGDSREREREGGSHAVCLGRPIPSRRLSHSTRRVPNSSDCAGTCGPVN